MALGHQGIEQQQQRGWTSTICCSSKRENKIIDVHRWTEKKKIQCTTTGTKIERGNISSENKKGRVESAIDC